MEDKKRGDTCVAESLALLIGEIVPLTLEDERTLGLQEADAQRSSAQMAISF